MASLVDDAAVFPPGNAPLTAAVDAHRVHMHSWYADMVGSFVVSEQHLPALGEHLAAAPSDRALATTVVVTGGAGAIAPALGWADRSGQVDLRSIEVAARDDEGTPGGLAHNVSRLTTALRAATDVPAHVELPRLRGDAPSADWLRALDLLAATGMALKLRTGGLDASAHPPEADLVACLDEALDRELTVKCTAGLHHAVRRTSPEGWEQHGFLNVLVAVARLLDGAGRDDAAAVLGERDPDPLVDEVRAWPSDRPPPARRWLTSFGSCSVTEPLQELVGLRLLVPDGDAAVSAS